MPEIAAAGLDLAKNVAQRHGANASRLAVLRGKVQRGQVLEFPGGLPSCTVAMEACGGGRSASWATKSGRSRRST